MGPITIAVWLLVIACALIDPAQAENNPEPGSFWREFFARPSVQTPSPLDNPQTRQKIAFGEVLFNDRRLSGDGERACVFCHMPERAFTDGLARPKRRGGGVLKRNAPSLYNLAWGTHFNWDGSAESLEAQARAPITRPGEMAGNFDEIVKKLRGDREVMAKFEDAFPQETLSEDMILKSLAAYLRSLISPKTRFDRWIEGEAEALNEEETAGFHLFVGKAGCVACHGGWRLTDNEFHDIGVGGNDPGRSVLPGGDASIPAFKTPGLRELGQTAPYMHDGSIQTLEEVVDHYTGGFVVRPSLSSNMPRDLALTSAEKRALVAFLHTLSTSP